MNFKTIEWRAGKVIMLDQRALPNEKRYLEYADYKQVADAITSMVIRGAPAIGVAGAMGAALGAYGIRVSTYDQFITKFDDVCQTLEEARPTAQTYAPYSILPEMLPGMEFLGRGPGRYLMERLD